MSFPRNTPPIHHPSSGQGTVLYRLEKLSKSYGLREVCKVDFLEIYQGEILGIMGPSGAGKSTLLRLLHFLEPASSGVIYFNSHKISDSNFPPLEIRRQTTMVFQQPLLLNASVKDNVAYGLKLRGEKDINSRVHQALETVGLPSLARSSASTLSGGEIQRVSLARALVLEPKVLLLDEPTANLDPYNVSLIESLITRTNQEQGTTIVLVTHNVFQARRLAHRVMLLLEGKMIEAGRTEEIFTTPRDQRTAAFIRGEMVY